MNIPANTILYASDDTDASITEARAYIADNQLTSDVVKLIRVDVQVRVVAKIDFEWRK